MTAPASAQSPAVQNAPQNQPSKVKTLPPLSALTYYRRNIWRVLPIGGAILISVFLIASIVTLLNSVDSTITRHYGALRSFSILAPQYGADVPPAIVKTAQKIPNVSHCLQVQPYFVFIKTVFGEMPVPVYGVDHDQMALLASTTDNTLEPGGRWPAVNEAEVVLPRSWANNFGVKVGDVFDPNSSNKNVPRLVADQKVVGIFSGGSSIAVADLSYVKLSLTGTSLLRPSYLLLPSSSAALPGITGKLNALVETPTKFGFTRQDTHLLRIFSFDGMVSDLRKSLGFLYKFLTMADVLVIGAVALLSGFLANIYFEQRLAEFGLLSALGFRRERLARRLIVESSSLVLLAWLLGMVLTCLSFWALDSWYMTPHGLILSKINATALLYTLPTPILVGVASLATVLSRLYRLDPIEIMERR